MTYLNNHPEIIALNARYTSGAITFSDYEVEYAATIARLRAAQ